MFVGFSRVHSSDVPLVLNTRTGYISPQYHVVFDDTFSTVTSHASYEEPPSFWNEIDLVDHSYKVPVDQPPSHLNDDWLTPPEIRDKERYQLRENAVRRTYSVKKETINPQPPLQSSVSKVASDENKAVMPIKEFPTTTTFKASPSTPSDNFKQVTEVESIPPFKPHQLPLTSTIPPVQTTPTIRSSTRSTKAKPPTRYMHEFNLHEAFYLLSWTPPEQIWKLIFHTWQIHPLISKQDVLLLMIQEYMPQNTKLMIQTCHL